MSIAPSFGIRRGCGASRRQSTVQSAVTDNSLGATLSYEFKPDGTVTDGPFGKTVAFFLKDGTIKDSQYGQEIGHVDSNGTVKAGRFGRVLGVVGSDGTVKDGQFGSKVIGKVEAPVHKRGALLLILG